MESTIICSYAIMYHLLCIMKLCVSEAPLKQGIENFVKLIKPRCWWQNVKIK